ncbi:MAG: hypothetical protein ACRERV_11355 [Methylococcales bacterium]
MFRSHRIFFLIAITLLSALAFLSNSRPAFADDPNFSNVDDILHGRRRIFPVDDLVVTSSGPKNPVNATIVRTENGSFGALNRYDITAREDSFATGVGRMFNSPRDVVVTITTGQIKISDQDPNSATYHAFPLNVNATPNLNQFPMADFTGDGFMDFAYILQNNIYIVTAQNVQDISAGVFYSEPGAAPYDITNKRAVLAAGDFDGSGTPEVALASAQGNAITITLYAVQVTTNQGQMASITLTPAGSTTFHAPKNVNAMALVAGVYNNAVNPITGNPIEQLVVLYQFDQGKHKINLSSITMTSTNGMPPLKLAVANTLHWQKSDHDNRIVAMVSDRIDFFGAADQVVASVSEPGNYSHLAVFTLDNNLNIRKASETIVKENFSVLASIALGNFDQRINSKQPIDLEIGVLKQELSFFACNYSGTRRALVVLC